MRMIQVSRHVLFFRAKCRDLAGIAWSGVGVHNGPSSVVRFKEAGLATGFFASVIYVLDESTAKRGVLPLPIDELIIGSTVRQPGLEESASNHEPEFFLL